MARKEKRVTGCSRTDPRHASRFQAAIRMGVMQ
jgi:hypothetical protein